MYERQINKYHKIKPIETETHAKISDMPAEFEKVKEEYGVKPPIKTQNGEGIRIRDIRIHRSKRNITDVQKQAIRTQMTRPNRLQSHNTS